MTPLLRHPNAVPSLFSRGGDHDDDRRTFARGSGPSADRLESLAVALGFGGKETILGRSSRALAGTSLAIFAIGLPLMKATKLVVAISLAH